MKSVAVALLMNFNVIHALAIEYLLQIVFALKGIMTMELSMIAKVF